MGWILGRVPGSRWEWYTAVALVRYGWTFGYQISFFGGTRIAGGQRLDFMVYTLPLPTPLYVYGPHWHERKRMDRDNLQRQMLYNRLRGSIRRPVVFDEKHVSSQEVAFQSVFRTFGRAS